MCGLHRPKPSEFERRAAPLARHPPPKFKRTSHSLHKCAASAAACIGVPLTKIRFMGGWSKTIEVVNGKYIDLAMSAIPTA